MQNEKIKKTRSARKLFLVSVVLLVLVGTSLFYSVRPTDKIEPSFETIQINDRELSVKRAVTEEEKIRGLCCRDSLPENEGMLFVYEKEGDYGFWMKDTLIPLDIIWINAQKKVVHIEHSVQPASYPEKTFRSPKAAQYILETNAGWAKQNALQIRDRASF